MELHRKINPDWRFSDPVPYLLAEIATIESDRRYFELARIMDDVPERYWPAEYGPARADEDSSDQMTDGQTTSEMDSDARALAGAEQIRAEMGL
ncbi:hypothetical protein ACPXB3_21400 [Gordonia sp. DT219]|uniref:hypothetical protein n=1 Tax=Gordonia sp. DT219 TaxID=3416658 RepID=UPI003CEB20CD